MIAHAMADMTNTICGHDRDVLRWALELWATVTNGGMVVYSAGTGGAKVAKANAFGDANDPTKLAAIIAELLRECGVPDLSESEFADVLEVRVRAHGEQIMIARRLPNMHKVGGPLLEMPQVRALTLALLDAPNATAQDVERMIGEVAR